MKVFNFQVFLINIKFSARYFVSGSNTVCFRFPGGSLGREGKHDVIIPDINCSKYHMKFSYNEEENGYTCIDLGSRNGTFMNGKRMSNAKQESEPMKLAHGAVLQIGQTKLLCHIHDGYSTCGQCEPGLLTDNTATAYIESAEASAKSKPGNVNDDHKRQLKNLKKRYGLQDESEFWFFGLSFSFCLSVSLSFSPILSISFSITPPSLSPFFLFLTFPSNRRKEPDQER